MGSEGCYLTCLGVPPKRGGGRLQGCLIMQLNGAGASHADALDKCSQALLHCWKMPALRRHGGAWRAVLGLEGCPAPGGRQSFQPDGRAVMGIRWLGPVEKSWRVSA